MSRKLHDNEFSPEVLLMLRERDILGRANSVHLYPLFYNAETAAEAIVCSFQEATRDNPLLQTTPAEAWLAAKLMPVVEGIRARVVIPEPVLDAALKRYFRREVPPSAGGATLDEEKMCNSVEPYLLGVENLLIDLYDRRKSLRQILGISVNAYTVHAALIGPKPRSPLEKIVLQGINERLKNHQIARTLDTMGLKPRSEPSYTEMLRNNGDNFNSLKSGIKKKYSLNSPPPNLPVARTSSKKSKA